MLPRCVIVTLAALFAGWAAWRRVAAQEPLRSAIADRPKEAGVGREGHGRPVRRRRVRAARKELGRASSTKTKVATVIQTVESLEGKKIAEAAMRAARESETKESSS